jgi:hypothetical protein
MERDTTPTDRTASCGAGWMPRDLSAVSSVRVVPAGTSRHGLGIGVDKYADERLNLRCAVADARMLHALMVDPGCGCFPRQRRRVADASGRVAQRGHRGLLQAVFRG